MAGKNHPEREGDADLSKEREPFSGPQMERLSGTDERAPFLLGRHWVARLSCLPARQLNE